MLRCVRVYVRIFSLEVDKICKVTDSCSRQRRGREAAVKTLLPGIAIDIYEQALHQGIVTSVGYIDSYVRVRSPFSQYSY